MLTSGRFATYRPEPLVEELMAVPLPSPQAGLLKNIRSEADIDSKVFEAFGFKDAERVLIEDLFNVTLPDFQGNDRSVGRQRTTRAKGRISEPELIGYCTYFIRVLKAGFGHEKVITATIFEEDRSESYLPYRLVAFELGGAAGAGIKVSRIKLPELLKELQRLDRGQTPGTPLTNNVFSHRVARIYESFNGTPTVFVVKPDLCRYWTRSVGLNDADEVALDFYRWQQEAVRSEPAS
jgi:hypothetical protein